MSEDSVTTNCLFCNSEFETTLKSEGVLVSTYCSNECELSDEYDEYESETFEKFQRAPKDNWN